MGVGVAVEVELAVGVEVGRHPNVGCGGSGESAPFGGALAAMEFPKPLSPREKWDAPYDCQVAYVFPLGYYRECPGVSGNVGCLNARTLQDTPGI